MTTNNNSVNPNSINSNNIHCLHFGGMVVEFHVEELMVKAYGNVKWFESSMFFVDPENSQFDYFIYKTLQLSSYGLIPVLFDTKEQLRTAYKLFLDVGFTK